MENTANESGNADASGDGNVLKGPPAAKTPVSLLQELYVKQGVTPQYDLVQIEGQVHEPTFKYRVTVGNFMATGTGQSKKKAKHSAAKSVLEKIMGAQQRIAAAVNHEEAKMLQQQLGTPPAAAGQVAQVNKAGTMASMMIPDLSNADQMLVASPYDDGIEGNPIGELQELCMNRRLPPPGYEVSLEEGQPHERKFVIVCIVGKSQEAGAGKSKKLAKRQAAYKMLKRLKISPAEQEETSMANLDEDELAQGIAARERNKAVVKFYQNLRAQPGTTLGSLQKMDLNAMRRSRKGGPVELLEEIGREQHFNATFIAIDERSSRGDFHCLVQLSALPVAVCFGVGGTEKLAKDEAAMNALTYLKLMTGGSAFENNKKNGKE